MLYISKSRLRTDTSNIYVVRMIKVNRGNGSLSRILRENKPPKSWFDSPVRSGETIVAIGNIELTKDYIRYNKYVALAHISSILDTTVTLEELIGTEDKTWVD